MLILGIDPGGEPPNGTTGISLVDVTDTKITVVKQWAVDDGYWGFLNWLHSWDASQYDLAYVVCEKFVPYNKAADISPVRIEGVVGYVWPNVFFQPASGKNKAIPDSFLKKQGWYEDHSHHHDARESLRHVLFWLKKQHNKALLELMK